MNDPVCCFCMKAYDVFEAEQCWQCGDITCPNCISEEGTCPDCFKQNYGYYPTDKCKDADRG